MATGGDSWTQIFSKWNSGTYNNKVSRMVMAMIAIEWEGKSGGVPVAESC